MNRYTFCVNTIQLTTVENLICKCLSSNLRFLAFSLSLD